MFEEGGTLANLHPVLLAGLCVELLLDKCLGAMGLEKFTAYFIVVESELISQEAQGDTNVTGACQQKRVSNKRGYLRSRHVSESCKALTLDEEVHQVATQVLSLEVQSEELVVVSKSQSRANIESVLDPRMCLVCGG